MSSTWRLITVDNTFLIKTTPHKVRRCIYTIMVQNAILTFVSTFVNSARISTYFNFTMLYYRNRRQKSIEVLPIINSLGRARVLEMLNHPLRLRLRQSCYVRCHVWFGCIHSKTLHPTNTQDIARKCQKTERSYLLRK